MLSEGIEDMGNKIRNAMLAGAAMLLVGGGITAAVAAPSAPGERVALTAVSSTGDLSPNEIADVAKAAGASMLAPGRVKAVRAPGQAVKAAVLSADEQDTAKGDPRFERELIVARTDEAANIDTNFIPVPRDYEIPRQQAVVTVVDPATGEIVTVIYVGADEADRSARLDLAKLGIGVPTEVDVPKGLIRAEQVKAANAKG